ncbi:MAG TPA: hypothetical protein DDX84_02910 [Nitrospiraceae bacterium]|nr:MAG: hypothetical protein A2Z60_04245 [Nitrospirae bacterium RIFCSPLOWO2_02_42_7]HBI23164.1 hypothetical protein [Nitrospiraceae bacterium]
MPAHDIREMTDIEIINELSSVGIETTIDEFKEEAISAGSPTELANMWKTYLKERVREDFLYEAAFELWRRHLSDVKCPEMLAVFIDETINMYLEKPEEHDHASLQNIYDRIKEFYNNLLSEDQTPDFELFNWLTLLAYNDIEGFLLSFPFELARHGLADEAVNIDRWFADISSQPQNFLRDMGCILAEAGRRQEAFLQIEENLERFPNDVWVIINAGDAMDSLEEKERAEKLYLKAYGMAGSRYDKADVIQRLIEFYREAGIMEKAEAYESEYKALTESSK